MAFLTRELQRKVFKQLKDKIKIEGTVPGWFNADRPHNHSIDTRMYTGAVVAENDRPHRHETVATYDIQALLKNQVDEAIAHLVAELDGMAQRCEELEIELECMRNAFPEHDHDVMPKRRGNFNDY